SDKNATDVVLWTTPLKDTLVYQVTNARQYLEGDTAATLRLLIEALRSRKLDAAAISARRPRWQAEHDKLPQRLDAAERKAATDSTITVPLVAQMLREALP